MPAAPNRPIHVYPVGRAFLTSPHISRRLFSRRLACSTKRIRCSSTSTIPHAIPPSCKGSFPLPSLSQSVKDVLITPCKGCHETAHRNGCATGELGNRIRQAEVPTTGAGLKTGHYRNR